jgi:hypothetical protein
LPAGMQLEADLESNSAFDQNSESEPSPNCLANMASRSTWTWKEHQVSRWNHLGDVHQMSVQGRWTMRRRHQQCALVRTR